jgi:uncharacterized protein YmfQ (DUF2313 family)
MGIIKRALALSFPRGSIWHLIGDADRLLEGTSISLERALKTIRAAQSESIPATARDTLPEWYAALGMAYESTRPVAKMQAAISANFTARGSATRDGLAAQLAKEFPGLSVTETGANTYTIAGTVATQDDASRVASILRRMAPLHLIPSSSIIVLSLTTSSVCGVATCGLAVCGHA